MCRCVAHLQTPNMAICDANLVDGMPKSLTAFGGLDALVHALESYVSVCATDYTKGEESPFTFEHHVSSCLSYTWSHSLCPACGPHVVWSCVNAKPIAPCWCVCVCVCLRHAGMSLQAIKLIFEFLPRSYHNGAADPVAREKMHNAATIAGVWVIWQAVCNSS